MKRHLTEDNATGNRQTNKHPGTMNQKMKKNLKRMGGGGLSLEAFVNAKSRNDQYNPSLIKKQREFYKNAKCIRKYKKLKQQDPQNDPSASISKMENLVIPHEQHEEKLEEASKPYQKNRKNRKSERSLNELYERKREEDEKAKAEMEAIVKAKREGRERAESRRKDLKEKMLKKTKSGQPVMKYRIEHMLESIKASTS
ncbi:stress response protein NST1 [Impatiens glandulifera]|uniref:stress response protein NST1 n=1 Tax=Impatiens glandulifera TaxID=253017 RepID=UPI001FB0B5C2|nr:stress response protein NST1 [Impatiens glandulifera]